MGLTDWVSSILDYVRDIWSWFWDLLDLSERTKDSADSAKDYAKDSINEAEYQGKRTRNDVEDEANSLKNKVGREAENVIGDIETSKDYIFFKVGNEHGSSREIIIERVNKVTGEITREVFEIDKNIALTTESIISNLTFRSEILIDMFQQATGDAKESIMTQIYGSEARVSEQIEQKNGMLWSLISPFVENFKYIMEETIDYLADKFIEKPEDIDPKFRVK